MAKSKGARPKKSARRVIKDDGKPHQRVRITEELLTSLDPCDAGLNEIRSYLPLTISTDPEANIKVAQLLVSLPRAGDQWHDASWLATKVITFLGYDSLGVPWPDIDHYINALSDPDKDDALDPTVVMQHLAMAADFLLRAEEIGALRL